VVVVSLWLRVVVIVCFCGFCYIVLLQVFLEMLLLLFFFLLKLLCFHNIYVSSVVLVRVDFSIMSVFVDVVVACLLLVGVMAVFVVVAVVVVIRTLVQSVQFK